MGLFSGIENAQIGGNATYFLEGKYRVRVDKAKVFQNRKGDFLFVAEMTILESTNPKRLPGTTASHVINKRHEAFLGDVKGFISAVNNCDPAEVTEEIVELVISDENPLGGLEVMLTCTEKTTKAGNPFTVHRYSPIEG